MLTLVDSCVWSLALRRKTPAEHWTVDHLRLLIRHSKAEIIGPIRQELLSGIRDRPVFERLREALRPFLDVGLVAEDYETAAEFSNMCRAKGIQGSPTDFLICAVGWRRQFNILTTDADFLLYQQALPISVATEDSPSQS